MSSLQTPPWTATKSLILKSYRPALELSVRFPEFCGLSGDAGVAPEPETSEMSD
jgi:hypothetical protein